MSDRDVGLTTPGREELMTQQSPTIGQALAMLSGREREQLSHLSITTAHLTCHTRGPEPAASGPIATEPEIAEQLQQLEQMGLVGSLHTETQEGITTVTLWADQRQEWTERMELLKAHPHAGGDLLERAARVKLERARWQAATQSAADRASSARASGLAESTITALLQQDAHRLEPTKPAPSRAAEGEASTTHDAQPPTRAGFVRMPLGHSAPCVVCATPATHTFQGQALHQGECANSLTDPPQPAPARSPAPPADVETQQPTPPQPTPRKSTKRKTSTPNRTRFAAAVAAWDGDYLYLPGQERQPFTNATHLGSLAGLVATHRLGHGGGAARPDRGEVLILPAALEGLGLPQEVARSGYGAREARTRAREEIFEQFTPLGVVQDALAAGWELRDDRMDVRTLITHPEKLPGGAQVTVVSWMEWQGNPLFTQGLGDDAREVLADPQTIVDRLQEFADRTGGAWRISPGQTGTDLVDIDRPPLPAGSEPEPGRLVFGVRPDLPQFLAPAVRRDDSRFAKAGEEVFNWYRPWSSLGDEEKSRPFVIAFDHGGNFRGPFTSTELPTGDLRVHSGDDARWDGKEVPGYWMVSAPDWDAPMWNLPNPADAGGFILGEHEGHENTRIVTAHMLKQLAILDEDWPGSLTYHRAWIWHEHTRYLRGVGEKLSTTAKEGSPEVVAASKMVYAQMVQKFASLTYPPTQKHLRLPPVRDFIVGAARTSILRTLVNTFTTTGISPLAVSRDTIYYALDSDDPQQAWPGDSAKYGTGPGKWKPVGIAPMEEWGPTCLPAAQPGLGNRFDYDRAMKNMTALNPSTGAPIEGSDAQ